MKTDKPREAPQEPQFRIEGDLLARVQERGLAIWEEIERLEKWMQEREARIVAQEANAAEATESETKREPESGIAG